MGTAISVELADPMPRPRLDALADAVFAWFHEVDRRFSTYRADSEVSTYGQPGVQGSDLLTEVLARCATLWVETDGYFDAYATGRLDPSGYVKGWAVQVASDRLVAEGCRNHCLNAGGDVRVRGGPEPSDTVPLRSWRVGVRHPWRADQVCLVIEGDDLAVATSGVYERGHHVLDPYTGAAPSGLRSVTVVGPDLGVADAYATAAMAMGERGTRWLAGRSGWESAVVTDDRKLFTTKDLPAATSGLVSRAEPS